MQSDNSQAVFAVRGCLTVRSNEDYFWLSRGMHAPQLDKPVDHASACFP